MEKQSVLPEAGFIRLPTVLALIPGSKTTWWEGIRKGIYPAPVKLGPRIAAWRVQDIRNLMEKVGQSA